MFEWVRWSHDNCTEGVEGLHSESTVQGMLNLVESRHLQRLCVLTPSLYNPIPRPPGWCSCEAEREALTARLVFLKLVRP